MVNSKAPFVRHMINECVAFDWDRWHLCRERGILQTTHDDSNSDNDNNDDGNVAQDGRSACSARGLKISRGMLPNDQTSDLLLKRLNPRTSGGAHLMGNLAPKELVYSSSSTNLQTRRRMQPNLSWYCQANKTIEQS